MPRYLAILNHIFVCYSNWSKGRSRALTESRSASFFAFNEDYHASQSRGRGFEFTRLKEFGIIADFF